MKSRLLLAVLVLLAPLAGATTLGLSQQPLFLTTGVGPNFFITIDNSNSMQMAMVPDALNTAAIRVTRRAKSAAYNGLYYNPSITYVAPFKVVYDSSTGTLTKTRLTTSFTAAYVNGFRTGLGTVDLSSDYKVSWGYNPNITTTNADTARGTTYANPGLGTNSASVLAENPSADFLGSTKSGVAAYYYLYDKTLSTCTSAVLTNDACYKKVAVSSTSGPGSSDERQNFAIWYSFYRSRALAAQSSTNLALVDIDSNIRVGWQALASCTLSSTINCRGIGNTSASAYDNRLRTFSGAHRQALFDWLGDIYYNSNTPLHGALARVGSFLTTTGVDGPYAYDPGTTTAPIYSCRASYSLMVTDGVWNVTYDVTGEDNASHPLGDGTTYSPIAPYKDSATDTLADLAFQYWYTDANTSIANKVPPYTAWSTNETFGSNTLTPYWNPRNDPATWQHLTGFYVGIGLSSALTSPAWGGSTFAGGYSSIAAGTLSWPKAASGSDNNVYDLWHAAINSRGAFFSADDASSLVGALGAVVTRISQATSAAASQVSSPMLDSTASANYTYVPTFSNSDWSGDLIQYLRTATTATPQWSAQARLDSTYGSGAYASRTVKMAASGGGLQNFTWSNLNTAQQAALNKTLSGSTDSYGAQRVDYLRGARTYESTSTTPAFRIRNHILGDIIDSTPVRVSAPSSPTAKMNALVTTSSDSYSTFQSTWAQRATRLYVGGNDGMLHGFDDNGAEQFAFIPSAVFANLYKLTDPGYTNSAHQYYVDGTPVVQDVYFGGAWHTVLIGTLRGGGRGLFALDITDPANVSLLWEKSASDYPQLGYTYARPVVARLQNGSWAVVLANGYGSSWTSGANTVENAAVLYLLNVADGSLISSLIASASGSAVNGLSSPLVLDVDGDLVADYAYAGDLQGHLWRFDLIGSNASAYAVAFGGNPLYNAQATRYGSGVTSYAQAITAAPYALRHPSGTGWLLTFGTGKYLESADATADTTRAMSLYGIWDRQATGDAASSTPPLTAANLQAQTLGSDTTLAYTTVAGTTVSTTVNTLSTNSVDWYSSTNTSGRYGWYLNLPLTGELVINKAMLVSDTLLFTSLTPNNDPCESGAVTYLYALDPTTGGASNTLTLGTSTDYSRVQMAGLLAGGAISSYGGSIVVSGTGSSGLPSGDGKLPTLSARQTWRTLPNQNPD